MIQFKKNKYNIFYIIFQQIPAATTMAELVYPHFGLGLGIGIVDSALVPMLANLVDTRHPNLHYGAVYALQQTAVSLAYSVGKIKLINEILGLTLQENIIYIS